MEGTGNQAIKFKDKKSLEIRIKRKRKTTK
jgi:hypothetical protein